MQMAFPDTITVTINTVAKTLNRVRDVDYGSEYRLRNANIEEYRVLIKNSSYVDRSTKVAYDRHSFELTHTVHPVAPATTPTIRKSYLVLENQQTDTIVDPVKHAAGMMAFLTEANLTKLVNFES
jgi:hypothetical protein